MADNNPLNDHLLESLNESEGKRTSIRNEEIEKQISHFNTEHEPRMKKMAASERDRADKRVADQVGLIMGGVPAMLGNMPSPDAAARKYSNHRILRPENSAKIKKPTWFVVDEDGPDGKLKKGANHKRGFNELDFDNLRKLQALFRERATTAEHAQHDRAFLQNLVDRIYQQSTHLQSLAYNADLEVGHEASAMSGKSPGRGRPRKQHSTNTTTNPPDNRPEESISCSILEGEDLEIADSQDSSYEKEGVVVTSRRLKPNTKEKVKQHNAEADAVNSAKDEAQYAHAHNNARDSRDSHENKDAPKTREPWSAAKRYHSEANSRPDYGDLQIQRSAVSEASSTIKMRTIPGAPKPVNRLNGTQGNLNQPFAPPSRINKPAEKPFDIQNNAYNPPAKRQKTGVESTARAAQSHVQVIDLETRPSHKAPSTRSLHSNTQNGQSASNGSRSGNPVPEYSTVQVAIQRKKTRRKEAGSLNSQSSKSGGAHRFAKPTAQNMTGTPHDEVAADPISDNDVDLVGSGMLGSTTPQVVITYKSNANLGPARDDPYGGAGKTRTTTYRSTGPTSPYFGQGEQRDSSESNSEMASQFLQTKRDTLKQNGNPAKESDAFSRSKRPRGSDFDLDELSREVPKSTGGNTNGRTRLLGRRTQTNGSSAAAKIENRHNVDIDDSEDERKKADMIQTLPKNNKPKKVKGEDQFDVLQIFCETYAWLPGGSIKRWSLRQNCSGGVLAIFDEQGSAVKDLDLAPISIRKIMHNNVNGKLQLFKAADETAKRASKIFLELGNFDQMAQFSENMKKFSSEVGMILKPADHIDTTFENIQNKIKPPTMKRQRLQEVPQHEDSQYLTHKSQQRVSAQFDKAQAVKQPVRSQGMKDRMGKGEEESHPPNFPRTRRTRSSSEVVDADSQEARVKMRKLDPMLPSSFYSSTNETGNAHGTRSSKRLSNRELLPQAPPRPRSPSPIRWTELNPNWEKDWRNSIIYPKEGKNKATVDKQDIPRLDEGEFLNDNLIMFYLLRLERDLAERRPDLAKRIYFHNTFFYERLSKPAKGKKGINYEAVERWTAKVDLFSYDYIIVPVNEHTHWYVAIICNAPKLLDAECNVLEDSPSLGVSRDARKYRSDSDAPDVKSSPTSSPRPRPTSPSETSLTEPMKQVSLIAGPAGVDQEEWPDDELDYKEPIQRLAPKNSSPYSRSDRHTLEEPPKLEQTPIEVEETSKPAATAKKGKRRSFTPAPRKYNPKEPRIITLDSLGIAHSPTCTNLRDYLIAEMKSKLKREIPVPQTLGMKAVGIPQQQNFCDCGLFLLSYIEQFLKCPDEFTEALLQKVDIKVKYTLTPAPKMRNRIRKHLFGLQAEQMADEDQKAEAKTKAKKKASRAQGKDEPATSTNSNSREASKSARASVDVEGPVSNRAPTRLELAERDAIQQSANRFPQPGSVTREPTPEPPADSRRYERKTDGLAHEFQTEPHLPKAPKRVSREPIDLESEAQGAPDAHNLSGKASEFLRSLNPFSRLEDDTKRSDKTRLGRSLSDAMQIDDESPRKGTHDVQQTLDPDSPSTQLQEEEQLAEEDQNLISPSPEPQEILSTPRGGLSTPYPLEHGRTSPDHDETQDSEQFHGAPKRKDSQTIDSSPPQSPPKPASDVINIPDDDEARKEEANEDDDLMLLDQEIVQAPPLLGDSPSTPLRSSEKRQSATSPRRESSRKLSPRKGSKSSEPTNSRRPSGSITRDPSDFAIIGNAWKGKRIKFPSP